VSYGVILIFERRSEFLTIGGNGNRHLFFLPGVLGTYNSWEKNTTYFSADYTVYLINYPDYSDAEHGYALSDFVLHARKIIESFDLSEVFLIGHSMGGQVAAILATQLNNIAKLVLVSSPSAIEQKTKFEKQSHFLSTAASLEKVLRTIVYDKTLDAPDFIQNAISDFFGSSKQRLKSLIRTVRLNKKTDISPSLKQINIPVLIIWGRNDEVIHVRVAYDMQHLILNAKLIVFDQCGHAPQFEAPAKFNAEVDSFLQGQ